MGGGSCVIIIEGNGVQGQSYELITTAQASCQLVEYLSLDPDEHFNDADTKPIQDFHKKAEKVVADLVAELKKLNRDLAAKYNRDTA